MVSLRAGLGCFLPLFLLKHSQVGSTATRHIAAGECSLVSTSISQGMEIKIRVKCNTLASCLHKNKDSPPVHIDIQREASDACGK